MVSTTINTGEVLLEATDPAFVLDPELLRRLVFDGGATLHAVRIEGTGTLARAGDGWRATFCGSGQAFEAVLPRDFSPPEGKEALLEGRLEVPREGKAALRMALAKARSLSD